MTFRDKEVIQDFIADHGQSLLRTLDKKLLHVLRIRCHFSGTNFLKKYFTVKGTFLWGAQAHHEGYSVYTVYVYCIHSICRLQIQYTYNVYCMYSICIL